MAKLVGVLVVVTLAVPAAADVPRTLHMRRVAQAPPDAGLDDAAPPPDDAAPPPDVEPVPEAAPPPAPAPAEPAPPPPSSVPEEDTGKIEVISVSGSATDIERITGVAPVSVVTRADLDHAGHATLGDVLQALPAQGNGENAQTNAGGDGTTRLSLRGLGAPRTVVLINGRRVVNGGPGADSSVDVNAIPLAMIERVEVLKDGGSTLYAGDAVGGVVNVVTRPQFDGTDVALLTSTSQRGDGTELDASFVTGFTADDKRIYAVISAGYQQHGAVLGSDRGFSAFQRSFDFASRIARQTRSLATPGGRLDASSIGGGIHIPGCGSDVCKPDGNGGWTDFAADDLYDEGATTYLYTPSSRYNIFGTGGARISDKLFSFAEVLYQHRDSDRELSLVPFDADAVISKDSLYNPFGADIRDFRRRFGELGPRIYNDNVRLSRFVAGIRGESTELLPGWKYEVSVNYGETKAYAHTKGQLFRPMVADALGPSMLDANGVPICVRVPGDPSTKITYPRVDPVLQKPVQVPCVPLNILSPNIPADQLALLTYTDLGDGNDALRGALATASGEITKLPNHGVISLVVGGNYRSEKGFLDPLVGASFGESTDPLSKGIEEGELAVTEGFGEVSIVPIADQAIARRVEVDLGARFVHHNLAGNKLVYKASGLFRTVHDLAVRGTYATAFRPPTFFDLFGGQTERMYAAEDPCDTKPPSVGDGTKSLDPMVQAQCSAQGVPAGSKLGTNLQVTELGGNPDLEAETAATASLGIVFAPLEGLALSADYWHIAIDNAIETLGIQTIFANCYDRGIQAFCDQIHRDPTTHRISPVDQFLQNIKRTTTSGIDLAIWYDMRLADLGRLHTGLEAQYLLRYDLDTADQVVHGAGFYDLGAFPRIKANLTASWQHPSGASGGFALRYVGSFQECAANDCNTNRASARDVGQYLKVDLFGAYDLRTGIGKTTFQLGITNVFDAAPPIVYNAPEASSDAATYDFVGRMVYLRLAQLF